MLSIRTCSLIKNNLTNKSVLFVYIFVHFKPVCSCMTIDTLTLISLALTIALIFALISFINVVILNKKLTKAKDEVENFNLNLETSIFQNISREFEAPVSTIIRLIDKLKKTVDTNVTNGYLVDFKMLSLQSEKLKLLIEGVNSLSNIKYSPDNDNIVFGNLISYYQHLFESFSELAEIKKIDYLLHSNLRVLNIYYCPEYLHTLFSNLTGKLLKDSSEGDKVKIEINLDKSLKHYKLVFNSSNISENSLLQIESDLAILVTKKVVRRLNGIFEIKHSSIGEIIYYVKLPLSKELNNQPMGCLTIHKPIKTAPKREYTRDNKSDNNAKINIDPDFLNRVTSIIYREITNTENIIEVISSEICISSSQLNRRIKIMTGMTTSIYILKTRLNRAKKMLTTTQKPIGEIAMECGFNDFAYFSRSFKKEFEMTPTTFQRIPH